MKISLTKAGKRFNREWIFRNFQYEFMAGTAYAITGPNGSGKSTLLQATGGALALSEGAVTYTPANATRPIEPDQAFQYLSIAAPYLELIEEMTVTEFLQFHQQFKPLLPNWSIPAIITAVGLEKAAHKQIRFYSSGMKQRVKLAQAIFSHVPCILLDEPCTNLDAEGISLYHQLIDAHCSQRLVIVSSNDPQEYSFCREQIRITDYR
ncbi:MAG: ATP-binding cassette domain-containing protein [Candidatus Pseudobacter hemicellulosilyticus]|uniref:ATP-binding cassette domain-containing protein n=1 Tax=Candidatus Pseudobacter hemicellulosilyticus TaxID=3121375 RepID=A0AAJ5WVA6_9BACT|nr:MAG: ATP-binding cassette domain-containing protein [Pseudobacter sp.]